MLLGCQWLVSPYSFCSCSSSSSCSSWPSLAAAALALLVSLAVFALLASHVLLAPLVHPAPLAPFACVALVALVLPCLLMVHKGVVLKLGLGDVFHTHFLKKNLVLRKPFLVSVWGWLLGSKIVQI